MDILSNESEFDNTLQVRIEYFFKKFSVGRYFKAANGYKERGMHAMSALMTLVQLVFTHKSLHRNYTDGTNCPGFAQDTVYRLLNCPAINWAAFILGVAATIITKAVEPLTDNKRLNALVFDDTMFCRQRSKKVELLARCFDHAEKSKGKYKRGFRLLTMAWTDGATLIPLMFRHLSSSKKENRYQEMKEGLDKRSIAYKIRQQALTPATELMLDMLRQAKRAAIPAKYVLFDSWFTGHKTVISVANLGFRVVGMLKRGNAKFKVGDSDKTVSQIYAANRKRPGRSKYLLSVVASISSKDLDAIPVKIVYIRDRNNSKKWLALVSTDLSLSEQDVIALYGKRWDIEVFFKVCKSYLKLSKEFQQISYDSTTAHTAIVFLRYMLIAYEKRVKDDWRTCGDLFYYLCDEVADVNFDYVLSIFLEALREALTESLFHISMEEIDNIIDIMISKLPAIYRLKAVKLSETA